MVSAVVETTSGVFLGIVEFVSRNVVVDVASTNGALGFNDHAATCRWFGR